MELIFDLEAAIRHRARAAALLPRIAPVLAALAAPLLDRLDDTTRQFATALDFGGRGAIAPALIARGMTVTSADFCPQMAALAGGQPLTLPGEDFGLGEARYDLVIAHFALHWINDLPGALIQLRRALKAGGLLLATVPVLGTLSELRAALLEAEAALTGGVSPRVSPFPELRDCAGLLQRAGFVLPVAEVEDFTLQYAEPLALLHELRAAGETNAVRARGRRFAPRALFPSALAALPVVDGRVVATLRMATLTGWAP